MQKFEVENVLKEDKLSFHLHYKNRKLGNNLSLLKVYCLCYW